MPTQRLGGLDGAGAQAPTGERDESRPGTPADRRASSSPPTQPPRRSPSLASRAQSPAEVDAMTARARRGDRPQGPSARAAGLVVPSRPGTRTRFLLSLLKVDTRAQQRTSLTPEGLVAWASAPSCTDAQRRARTTTMNNILRHGYKNSHGELLTHKLSVRNEADLDSLPPGLRVQERLTLHGLTLRALPPDLQVNALSISDCASLQTMADDLVLRGRGFVWNCPALQGTPPPRHPGCTWFR